MVVTSLMFTELKVEVVVHQTNKSETLVELNKLFAIFLRTGVF